MVFATIVGILLFGVIMGIFGMMCIVGMVASSSGVKSVDDNSVMVLNLSGTMEERSQSDVYAFVLGSSPSSMGLDEILSAIKKAKEN